jgi:hypothetical protein
MDLEEIGYKDRMWVELVRNHVKWRDFLLAVSTLGYTKSAVVLII